VGCKLTFDTIKAKPGDEVIVNLNIENNPGIMALTISITYDPEALGYRAYYYGNVFTNYTAAAHPTKKIIRLVISEKKDLTGDGVVASFKFRVADDAKSGLHEIAIEYGKWDFCNLQLESIFPETVSGGVEVDAT